MKQKLSTIIEKIKNLPILVRTIMLVAPILLIIGIISIILISSSKPKADVTSDTPAREDLLYARLVFTPNTITLEPGSIQVAPIMLDLGTNTAKRVEFSIEFDSDAVNLVDLIQKIDTTSALSNSLTTENIVISASEGVATITLALKEGAVEQIGSGEIAQFSFRINPAYKGKLGFTITNVTIDSDYTDGKVLSPQTNTLIVASP